MYEIIERRLVTLNGQAAQDDGRQHYFANVSNDSGYAKLALSDDGEALWVRSRWDDDAPFHTEEFLDAIGDLRRLQGIGPLSSEDHHLQERAAKAVEQACEELGKPGDPYRVTLAINLRTAMLALIERATRAS